MAWDALHGVTSSAIGVPMSDEDSDDPMTLEDAVSSAQEVIDQLRTRWKETGMPIEILAHAMIGAGITDLTNERGVSAALEVLRGLLEEIEQVAQSKPH
jgi:hypothetical protein